MPSRGQPALLGRFQYCARAIATRLAWAGAYVTVAVALAVAGAGFLVAALYLFLSERLSHPAAALVVGVLLLLLGVVLMLVANWNIGRACSPDGHRASAPGPAGDGGDEPQMSSSELAATLGATVGDETVRWTRAHPFAATAAALLAGVAVGVSPRVRSEVDRPLRRPGGRVEPDRR